MAVIRAVTCGTAGAAAPGAVNSIMLRCTTASIGTGMHGCVTAQAPSPGGWLHARHGLHVNELRLGRCTRGLGLRVPWHLLLRANNTPAMVGTPRGVASEAGVAATCLSSGACLKGL